MWTAHLYQTTTGIIGPKLAYASMSWSAELNGTETISLGLRKSDLPVVNLSLWLSAWWAGVVLMWNDAPIVAGPLLTRPSESIDSVSINCGGIRSILARRVVVKEDSMSTIASSNINYSNLSYGTIAQRVVTAAQQKSAGQLPISFPLPEESGTHERNYRGFNLQNIYCDDILDKLSNVIDGPDIMFRPRLLRDNQLTFDMWHGTNKDPRIAQRYVPTWDTTPARGQVSDMTVNYTGSYQASRVFSTGAGQDEGLLITKSEDTSMLQRGYPLLESVINRGSSENINTVRGYGDAHLQANRDALLEVQITVQGDDLTPFGSFWPGDLANIVTKGWLSIPDGITPMRVLSITGNGGSSMKVSLQRDDKFS